MYTLNHAHYNGKPKFWSSNSSFLSVIAKKIQVHCQNGTYWDDVTNVIFKMHVYATKDAVFQNNSKFLKY